ncbi:protein C19orf12 homolog [Nannospalax galili]|uniref:protein C19orf12 homolog n=1 Tax=Nannospalax galili TaxID=1026970 RepID=UPI0004ED5FED|nr:protein C19orf12 homolog [Nannospalax galili]
MPITVDDIIQLLCLISQNRRMEAAKRHSRTGAVAKTALGSIFGGLVAGPAGAVFGGAIVGLLGSWSMHDEFKPVPQILMELPPAKKQKLFNQAMAIIRNVNKTDPGVLTLLVMDSIVVQQKLLAMLEAYIFNELQADIRYRD